jgi:hypothetical protein
VVVNGLKLPWTFVELINLTDQPFNWVPKDGEWGVEAYGEALDVLPLEIYTSLEMTEWATAQLQTLYGEGRFHQLPADAKKHDFDLSDISKIVWFGQTASGEAYCFNYQENPSEPSVIYWDDGCWRRVAPNFESFISLFEPDK